MATQTFAYIWEYHVKEAHLSSFIKGYGPKGDWEILFKKAEGYIATDLHQDLTNPTRFITIDHWRSKKDRDNFLSAYSVEYKHLDSQFENCTEKESFIGDFMSFHNQ